MYDLFSLIKLQASNKWRSLLLTSIFAAAIPAQNAIGLDIFDIQERVQSTAESSRKIDARGLGVLIKQCYEEKREVRRCLNAKVQDTKAALNLLSNRSPIDRTVENLFSSQTNFSSKATSYADSDDICYFNIDITPDGRTLEIYTCIASRFQSAENPQGIVWIEPWSYLADVYPIITGGPSTEPCGKMTGLQKDTVGPLGNQTCYVPGGSSGSGGEGYPHWFLCIGGYCEGFYPGSDGMVRSTGQLIRDNDYLKDPATRCTTLETPNGCDLATFSICLYQELQAMEGTRYSIFAPATGNQCLTARQTVINRCRAQCAK